MIYTNIWQVKTVLQSSHQEGVFWIPKWSGLLIPAVTDIMNFKDSIRIQQNMSFPDTNPTSHSY